MDEELAGRAAEQYGRISQMRAEVVRAIAAGEYEAATSVAEQALELSKNSVELLDDAETAESVPHLVLAFALQADLTVARIAAGKPEEVESGVASLDPGLLLSSYIDSVRSDLAMAARQCPHGRASYTGVCLAKPPCPPQG